MKTRQIFSWSKTDFFWIAISAVVLLPCLYYPYMGAADAFDITVSSGNWEVLTAYRCPPGSEGCLFAGDRLLSIGGIHYREHLSNRLLTPFSAIDENGRIPVELIRNGEHLSFRALVRLPRPTVWAKLADLTPVVFLPLVLWVMGTVAILFLRPRDERWLSLVLFSYISAIWFAAGQVAAIHVGGSSIVFHLFVWFFLPLSAHLHLILPNALLTARTRKSLLAFLYGSAVVLSLLDSLMLLDNVRAYYVWSVLLGVAAPLILFTVRLFLPLEPAVKIANRIMLFGLVVGLGPFILFYGLVSKYFTQVVSLVSDLRDLFPWFIIVSGICLLILPMSYIYAIYKHHLGMLEFRANRLLGVYSYMALSTIVYVLLLFAISSRWKPINVRLLASLLVLSLVFVLTTPLLRNRFQTLIDSHIFGIRHSPEEVIELVSERIPTAFDRAVLARVIADEILPALLIRQSALYLIDETGVESLYEQAVPVGEPPPDAAELRALQQKSGRYIPPDAEPATRHGWVRLVIPLTVQAKTIGVWLIGRRDPDDFFPVSDIHLLSTVANQIAPMVENIRLYERAQQEIAQRKAAEEEIRRNEERFRTLFEATLEGIAIVRNGVILEVNHSLLGIFGHKPGELIGHQLSNLISGSEAELDDVPQEGIGYMGDGTPLDIEIAGKKYVFQGEDVTVIAIRDIAQRKRDEAENKMLQRQLLLSQKMEAIGRLSAGVAHDFNNCLLAIFGYSDLLLDRYAEDGFLCRNVSGIKEAGQRAAALTKQLLAFARRQPMETRVLDPNPIVANLEKMLQRLLGEDISLATSLHPEVGKIRVDAGQIEQVIVNLAVNARHAMPSGGKLSIRTAPMEVTFESPARHANVPPGSYVLLMVEDTGVGMDAETQARIFEPFFSTKGEGTGLGLATAYGIVRQSSGHIFVDSTPGKGACFSLYLPVSRDTESPRTVSAGPAADSGTETILLVEDEDDVRKVLHQILIGKGYRVIQASSGDEALAISRLHRGSIHLLLSDVNMPRMKGPELATRLLADRPQTRVVYMSGYNDEVLQAGKSAWICLQKPFTPQALAQTVRSILDTPAEEEPHAATA